MTDVESGPLDIPLKKWQPHPGERSKRVIPEGMVSVAVHNKSSKISLGLFSELFPPGTRVSIFYNEEGVVAIQHDLNGMNRVASHHYRSTRIQTSLFKILHIVPKFYHAKWDPEKKTLLIRCEVVRPLVKP